MNPLPVSECAIPCNEPAVSHAERTIAGISEARERGVQWGTFGKLLAERNRNEAQAFAEILRPLLIELGVNNIPRPTAIARELNRRKVPTPLGRRWHPTSVRRLLARLGPSLKDEIRAISIPINAKALAKFLLEGHPLPKSYSLSKETVGTNWDKDNDTPPE